MYTKSSEQHWPMERERDRSTGEGRNIHLLVVFFLSYFFPFLFAVSFLVYITEIVKEGGSRPKGYAKLELQRE